MNEGTQPTPSHGTKRYRVRTADGTDLGEMTQEQLERLILMGGIDPSDMLQRVGSPRWHRAIDAAAAVFRKAQQSTERGRASEAGPAAGTSVQRTTGHDGDAPVSGRTDEPDPALRRAADRLGTSPAVLVGVGAALAITVLAFGGFLAWMLLLRDTWEEDNRDRVFAECRAIVADFGSRSRSRSAEQHDAALKSLLDGHEPESPDLSMAVSEARDAIQRGYLLDKVVRARGVEARGRKLLAEGRFAEALDQLEAARTEYRSLPDHLVPPKDYLEALDLAAMDAESRVRAQGAGDRAQRAVEEAAGAVVSANLDRADALAKQEDQDLADMRADPFASLDDFADALVLKLGVRVGDGPQPQSEFELLGVTRAKRASKDEIPSGVVTLSQSNGLGDFVVEVAVVPGPDGTWRVRSPEGIRYTEESGVFTRRPSHEQRELRVRWTRFIADCAAECR